MEQRLANGIGYVAGAWPLDPGKATLVFIHGAGGTSAFWSAQLQGLVERVNTVAVDLPGHGHSTGDGKSKIADYAQAVVEFISQIAMPKTIPCGLSMGGAITQQLLIDHRDQIEAGILVSTGARLKVAPVIFETIEKDYSAFVEMIGKMAVSAKTGSGPAQAYKDELAGCNPEVTKGDFQACNRFDAVERLTAIEAPVLVVSAQDDKLTPPKYADVLEMDIKNASRSHIMDAGHIVPMEKPLEFNQAILEFLDRNGL
jgi:pimeloyl-ACP methyl ester carboxylesterase